MSLLISGTWKMSYIEFRNIQVGKRGPPHMMRKKKITNTATSAICATLVAVSTVFASSTLIYLTMG